MIDITCPRQYIPPSISLDYPSPLFGLVIVGHWDWHPSSTSLSGRGVPSPLDLVINLDLGGGHGGTYLEHAFDLEAFNSDTIDFLA